MCACSRGVKPARKPAAQQRRSKRLLLPCNRPASRCGSGASAGLGRLLPGTRRRARGARPSVHKTLPGCAGAKQPPLWPAMRSPTVACRPCPPTLRRCLPNHRQPPCGPAVGRHAHTRARVSRQQQAVCSKQPLSAERPPFAWLLASLDLVKRGGCGLLPSAGNGALGAVGLRTPSPCRGSRVVTGIGQARPGAAPRAAHPCHARPPPRDGPRREIARGLARPRPPHQIKASAQRAVVGTGSVRQFQAPVAVAGAAPRVGLSVRRRHGARGAARRTPVGLAIALKMPRPWLPAALPQRAGRTAPAAHACSGACRNRPPRQRQQPGCHP